MRTALTASTLALVCSCGSFVRTDSLAGPIYDACMERKDADRSDRDADRACIDHARWKARSEMDEGSSTTVCNDIGGGTVICKTRPG